MECRAASNGLGVYRGRNPRDSPLYLCVARHADELRATGRIHRSVEEQALDRFLDFGDLHQGFARIHCDQCGHDYLLAFSCKTRCFCPSCHQRRMLESPAAQSGPARRKRLADQRPDSILRSAISTSLCRSSADVLPTARHRLTA